MRDFGCPATECAAVADRRAPDAQFFPTGGPYYSGTAPKPSMGDMHKAIFGFNNDQASSETVRRGRCRLRQAAHPGRSPPATSGCPPCYFVSCALRCGWQSSSCMQGRRSDRSPACRRPPYQAVGALG